jgi:hypothetical protein
VWIVLRAFCSAVRPTDLVSLFAPAFDASGAEWMVAGGVASIVYGEPRLTQDMYIVARVDPMKVDQLVAQLPDAEFYSPPAEVVRDEARRSAFGHFNLLHLETDARADVYLVGTDALARRGLIARRNVQLAGRDVPIAAPEYVILHKLRFRQQGASERHLRDIRGILRIMGDAIDIAALELEAAEIGLAKQWQEIRNLQE